ILLPSFYSLCATLLSDHSPLSLHDALPISQIGLHVGAEGAHIGDPPGVHRILALGDQLAVEVFQFLALAIQVVIDQGETAQAVRSEEHTSELQSRENLVCRLLLEKKKECKE